MTEEEAKTKWCPMVRFEIGPQNAAWQNVAYSNRGEEFSPRVCRCIASDCMMWRGEPDGESYCGLGGRP
jgi:hypothetical protein